MDGNVPRRSWQVKTFLRQRDVPMDLRMKVKRYLIASYSHSKRVEGERLALSLLSAQSCNYSGTFVPSLSLNAKRLGAQLKSCSEFSGTVRHAGASKRDLRLVYSIIGFRRFFAN